jgi:pimeloyl-ACP methyl ester carboxylesterase
MLRTFSAGQLFAEQSGTGYPTVLALHGWGRDHRDFSSALADLDALAVDLPGFGLSPPPVKAWGTVEYAQCLLPVLGEFQTPPIVIGHSFGGRVAVRLAVLFPDRIGGLVLTGVPLLRTNHTRVAPPRALRLARSLNRINLVSSHTVEQLRNRYGSADYRAAQGVMRKVLVRVVNENYEQDLQGIRCPVQLVWGSVDAEALPEVAHRAAEMISQAELVVVPDVGHMLPLSVPGELRAAVHRARGPSAR